MLRVWGKIYKKGRIKTSVTVSDGHTDWTFKNRFYGLMEEIVRQLDLAMPIWLDNNKEDLRRFGYARFTQDNFIEPIGFDYLECQIIEVDKDDDETQMDP